MIGILGAGSWGAGLSMVLNRNGHPARIWTPFEQEAEQISRTRRLPHKLPGVVLPEGVGVTHELGSWLNELEALIVAVPSAFIASTAERLKEHLHNGVLLVSCTKGIEAESCRTMTQVLQDALPGVDAVVALSGPTHAEEVSRNLPTAIVAASTNEEAAKKVQALFQQTTFRVYTNLDILGVELGGALKNVIAIATGICDGLGYGDNARAALITRGLAEITRLAVRIGAQPDTFAGLSGMGDIIVTCTSRHSRNRKLGELLAQGYDLESAQEEIGMVAEGATTAKAIANLQARYEVEMPISAQVAGLLFENLEPKQAVNNLLSRAEKAE